MGSIPIIYNMYLNWNKNYLAKLILFHQFYHFNSKKKIKNNQFNLKWYFNRFLFSYYQHKFNNLPIENRLDLILFRTNWFKSYHHLKYAILSGNVFLNNQIVLNPHLLLKKGDLISLAPNTLLWNKFNLNSKFISKSQLPYLDWLKNKSNFLIQNPVYLEINNNIKSIIILSIPHFKNIPYPFNLNKMIL